MGQRDWRRLIPAVPRRALNIGEKLCQSHGDAGLVLLLGVSMGYDTLVDPWVVI